MPGRDEQIDRIEPNLQRRAGVLKNRPGSRVNVVPAVGARKGAALRELVEGAVYLARTAGMPDAKSYFHDVAQTGGFVRETGEELAYGEPSKLLKLRIF